jgi:hypothetical protein
VFDGHRESDEVKDECGIPMSSLPRTAATRGRFALIAILLVVGCRRETKQYLRCDLKNPANEQFTYSFAFDRVNGTLLWVEPSQSFTVTKNTDSELWAQHATRYRNFAYDQTDFRLNRVTGAAEVLYLRKPTADEEAACLKQRGWGCTDFFVVTEHSESGTCVPVERRIQ